MPPKVFGEERMRREKGKAHFVRISFSEIGIGVQEVEKRSLC